MAKSCSELKILEEAAEDKGEEQRWQKEDIVHREQKGNIPKGEIQKAEQEQERCLCLFFQSP